MVISIGYSVRNCLKDAVGWIFTIAVVSAFIVLIIMKAISPNRFASTEKNNLIDFFLESRCICVCPHNLNTTNLYNRTIFIKEISDPGKCTCLEVVLDADELLCLQCQCSFESRNSFLIAIIVYGVLILSLCCLPPCALVVCILPCVKVKVLRTYAGPSLHCTSQLDGATSRLTRIRRSDYDPVVETPT